MYIWNTKPIYKEELKDSNKLPFQMCARLYLTFKHLIGMNGEISAWKIFSNGSNSNWLYGLFRCRSHSRTKKRPEWAAYYLFRKEVWPWFSIFLIIAWERSRSDIHHFWLRFELKNCDPLDNTGTTIRIWNLSFLFFSSSWFVIASAISILIAYRKEREKNVDSGWFKSFPSHRV